MGRALAFALVLASGLAADLGASPAAEPAAAGAQAACASHVGPGIPPPASVPAGIDGLHAAWYGQSGYPSLCPGARSDAVVAFYNSGSRGWVSGRMGEVAYLGTWGPEPGQDRASVLGGDGQRGSPSTGWPRYDRAAVQPDAYVGPGQVAWFRFTVQAPLVPGTYRLGIRPLVEGATWLEDFGVYWYVTVLEADGSAPRATGPAGSTPIAFAWQQLTVGTHDGTRMESGALRLGDALASGRYADAHGRGTFDVRTGTWTSPWARSGCGFSELIASWNAETPSGTWLEIAMQATPDGIRETRWYVLGRWSAGESDIARTSVADQDDDDGRVATDTFLSGPTLMRAYRLRVTLLRLASSTATPTVTFVGAVASDAPNAKPTIPSATTLGRDVDLGVPRYSQEIHAGEYPEFDGGGEAWCSPTSTAMVLAHFGRGPGAAELTGIPYADPQVDHAARFTYDHAYRGTGNWPFNAAYAARYGVRAFVTQLRSLAEAERFIAVGIPLVASVNAAPGELPGFFLPQGTQGHLLVIAGVTRTGDVIANDPAARDNASVRKVYPRAAFERAWLGGSFGAVYVIFPPSVALPATPQGHTANW